jgi:hypothetical protein
LPPNRVKRPDRTGLLNSIVGSQSKSSINLKIATV